MTLPLYRCWKSSETEIVAALDSSWKSQYREFEFTSLRQQVSTAEKRCGFPLKIAENPRNSGSFAAQKNYAQSGAQIRHQQVKANFFENYGAAHPSSGGNLDQSPLLETFNQKRSTVVVQFDFHRGSIKSELQRNSAALLP